MKDIFKLLILILLLIGSLNVLGKVFTIIRADYYYKRSVVFFNDADFDNSYDYSIKAIRLNGYEPDYHVHKAKTIIGLVSTKVAKEEDFKKEALESINKAISLNDNNLVTKRNVIPLFYFLALSDLKGGNGENSFDSEYVDTAKVYYTDVLNNYPNDVGVISQIAVYQKKLGMLYEYGASRDKVGELRPDLLEWYISE
jgi:tetratricopeptide (TPR) repeat protein